MTKASIDREIVIARASMMKNMVHNILVLRLLQQIYKEL